MIQHLYPQSLFLPRFLKAHLCQSPLAYLLRIPVRSNPSRYIIPPKYQRHPVMNRSQTLEAEDKAFMLKLRDTTMAAIEAARFAQIVGVLEQSHGAKITGRVQDVIELTGKAYDLNQPEQDSILNYLIKGGDLSLYGLSNAITRASQDVESYDRATALEGIGWQVATMPANQWKEINA